jgi:hypothetical protein
MAYLYERRTAGRNGELRITGGMMGARKSMGKFYFKRPITMPPRFLGKDLDASINNLGKGFLETILRNLLRKVPNLQLGPVEGYASHQNDGLYLCGEADWVLLTNTQPLVEALESISDPLGFTLDNWLK